MRARRWLRTGGSLLVGVLAAAATCWASGAADYERLAKRLGQAIEDYQALAGQATKYDVVFHRDPLQALVDQQGTVVTSLGLSGGLTAQGIIWSDEHPLVVVDDELFKEGDQVGPYKVLKIRKDSVVVQRGEQTITVPLDHGLQ